jgi:hypothetical protein
MYVCLSWLALIVMRMVSCLGRISCCAFMNQSLQSSESFNVSMCAPSHGSNTRLRMSTPNRYKPIVGLPSTLSLNMTNAVFVRYSFCDTLILSTKGHGHQTVFR